MPRGAIVDLTVEDDDEPVHLIRRRDGLPADDGPAQPEASHRIPRLQPRPFVTLNAVKRQLQATIDLTEESTSASKQPGQHGSANEAGSALANDLQPDSRARNQNTSARTSGTTVGASSKPHARISGDTNQSSVVLRLTRVPAKAPFAALNPEHSPMSPGGIAHRPGNPYGRRFFPGTAAFSTRPPPTPAQDGSTPTRPHVISSSDEEDDESDDDDIQIDEERSTPANANRQAHQPRSVQEHVSSRISIEHRQGNTRDLARDSSSRGYADRDTNAAELEDQPAQFKHLSVIEAQNARGVKGFWGVFPWEVTTRNPPRFYGDLVQKFHTLVLVGCSLERARQLVEDQIARRTALSPSGPNYLTAEDIRNATTLVLEQKVEKPERSAEPSLSSQVQRSIDNSIVGAHPSLLPFHRSSLQAPSVSFQPSRSGPSAVAENRHSPLTTAAYLPVASRPTSQESTEPRLSLPAIPGQKKANQTADQPRAETSQAAAGTSTEQVIATNTQLQPVVSEAGPAQSTDSVPYPGQAMATAVDFRDTSQSLLRSDSPQVTSGAKDAIPNVQRDMEDPATYSITELEVLLKERLKEIQEDREYFTKFRLGRARRAHRLPDDAATGESANDFISGPSIVPPQFQQQAFPWPNAKPIQTRGPLKSGVGGTKSTVQKTQEVYSQSSKAIRSILSNPIDSYATDAIPVPPYTSYVSLKQNILAENHRTLMIYPYFDDFQDEDLTKKSLWDELRSRYNIVADELRRRRLLQAEQCWQVRSYAEKFLEDFGCPMKDILRYFLLSPEELVQCLVNEMQPHEAEYLQSRREESCKEEFNRERKRWRSVLTDLPPSPPAKVAFAAVFCPAWLSVFGFSFWHMVRRTPLAQPVATSASSQLENSGSSSGFAYRDFACRVCHVHNCPFHGAILEQPELSDHPDSDEESSSDDESSGNVARSPSSTKSNSSRRSSISSTGSLVNFKKLVNAQPRKHLDEDDSGPPPRRDAKFWASRSRTHIMERRPPFFPCSHKGSCSDAKCSCFKNGITCEKTCACAASCKRRYRGCTCAQEGVVCWKNKKCDCWNLNRECDPDLCATCGAAEVLDPVNRYNDSAIRRKCCNVNIQRNVPKRTLLGESEVQGFGLYMGERANAGDYIGEYKGEIVTKEEGSRRGAVYQHLRTNYLFDLNRAQEVDSTRAGNKLRFINNSARAPNCEPRVMLCNTVVRIGMFAIKDIKAGQELFFNYNYPHEVTKYFWEKGETKPSGNAYAVKSKKGGKQKTRIAGSSPSSDSELPSKGKNGKNGKAGLSQKAKAGRSRLGQSTLKGSSTINQFAWGTSGKRPRLGTREKQNTWAELNEYLDGKGKKKRTFNDSEESESGAEVQDEESSDDDDTGESPDSEEEERPKKRTRSTRL